MTLELSDSVSGVFSEFKSDKANKGTHMINGIGRHTCTFATRGWSGHSRVDAILAEQTRFAPEATFKNNHAFRYTSVNC